MLRPGPLFDRGPDAVRAALHFEPSTTGHWRPQVGVEVWTFAIGCAAVAGADCDPFGVSLHGAVAWYPLSSASAAPYLGAGIAALYGPAHELGIAPDVRAGVEILGRRPVALRFEMRVQPLVQRQRFTPEGDRRWNVDEAMAFVVGARIRLRHSDSSAPRL